MGLRRRRNSCSGSTVASAMASMASSAWLVTTMSASACCRPSRRSSRGHTGSGRHQARLAETLTCDQARSDAGAQLVAVAGSVSSAHRQARWTSRPADRHRFEQSILPQWFVLVGSIVDLVEAQVVSRRPSRAKVGVQGRGAGQRLPASRGRSRSTSWRCCDGGRRHHHRPGSSARPAARADRRHQVGQRLAGPGAGLTARCSPAAKALRHRFGHLDLTARSCAAQCRDGPSPATR